MQSNSASPFTLFLNKLFFKCFDFLWKWAFDTKKMCFRVGGCSSLCSQKLEMWLSWSPGCGAVPQAGCWALALCVWRGLKCSWGSTGNLPQCSRVVLHSTEQNQHFRAESAWPNCAGVVRHRSESSVWVTCAAHAGVWSKCEEGACVSHLLVSPKIWNEELLCCSDCSFNGKQMSVLTDAW